MKEIRKCFFKNGVLEEEAEYEQNRLHGTLKRFYPTGQIKERMHFINGIADGACIWYYENGRVKREMNYYYGYLNGEMIAYSESGSIKESWTFEKGEIVGCGALYHEGGALRKEAHFKKGEVARVTDYSKKASQLQITLYSKDGCRLCERVQLVIQNVRERNQFDLAIVDITQDQLLFEKYKNDIPVVLLNGKEIARHELSEARLAELLEKAN